MTAVTSIQGLASGIKWQDIVDQLAAVDSARELGPITAAITANGRKTKAWSSYQTLAQGMSDAAAGFKTGAALGNFQAIGGTSSVTGRALLTATAGTAAAPGDYQIEVQSLAQAEKLSGNAIASSSTALGFSGDVVVNGRKVTIGAADSLSNVRDSFNAVNTGSNASGVTATILSTAGGASRLVLTSDAAGSRGIQLTDSTSTGGALQQLGLVDGSYSIAADASGGSSSGLFTSSSADVASALGVAVPAATSIRVGNKTISLNLSADSLSAIASRIQAAGVGARVVTSTSPSGVSSYSLSIDANVSAIPSIADATVPDANSLRALQVLGFAQGGRGAVAQSVKSGPLLDASSAPATTGTLLSDLQASGSSANIQAGDTIMLTGRRADGTAVSLNYVVGGTSTLSDLLAQVNGTSGFGGGTRSATAAVAADGSLTLTDDTGGDSLLSLSLSVSKSVSNGGGSTGIGSFQTSTTGRLREVVSGSDARLRVDGVVLTRNSNTVSDAISGVTLNLTRAELGNTTTLSVSRDTSAAVANAQVFVKAYNDLISFVSSATATGGDLANNGSLRSSAQSITKALLTDITGSSFTRPTLVGMSLDKTGTLTLDTTKFTAALQSNFNGVQQLFGLNGTATGASVEYVSAGNATVGGTYALNITAAATTPSVTGTGATFPFSDGGTPRNLSVSDGFSGKTGSIALSNGDDASAIAAKLNALFLANGMRLSAGTSSGALRISSSQFGSGATFAVAYDAGDTTSAAQIGVAAQSYAGTDVQGTINGVTAAGVGQVLTGPAGTTIDGLVLRYSGLALGAVGSATVSIGTGALIAQYAGSVVASGDGLVASVTDQLAAATTRLQAQSADVTARLARRKTAQLAQFSAMETAIAKINAQSAQLTSMLDALTVQTSTK